MKSALARAGVCGIALSAALLAAGCTCGEKVSDEEQIKKLLDRFEEAVESGALAAALDEVSDSYRDNTGGNRAKVRQLLFMYLRRFRNIAIVMSVSDLKVQGDAATCRVTVRAWAGDKAEQVVPSHADQFDLEVTFGREAGVWKISAAKFDRALYPVDY